MVTSYESFGIPPKYRAKLIDWYVQVFRVFKKSTEKTFFQAVSLLDRYVIESVRLLNEDNKSQEEG